MGAEPINSETLASINADVQDAQDMNDVLFCERQARKANFIRKHLSYDKTFWILSQKDKLRRFCQRLVQPANGDRIFGLPHSPLAVGLCALSAAPSAHYDRRPSCRGHRYSSLPPGLL